MTQQAISRRDGMAAMERPSGKCLLASANDGSRSYGTALAPAVAAALTIAALVLSPLPAAYAQVYFVPSGTLVANGSPDYSSSIIEVGQNSSGYGAPSGYGYAYSGPGQPYNGTLDIVNPGSVGDVGVDNTSLVDMTGGSIGDHIVAVDNSTVDISGGDLPGYDNGTGLYVEGSATGNISGTADIFSMNARNSSLVNISGGTITNDYLSDTSLTTVTGGTVGNIYAQDDSTVNINGGTVADLYVSSNAHFTGTAGMISHDTIYDSSSIAATFVGLSLTFSDPTAGTDPNGNAGVFYDTTWTQADGTVDDTRFFQQGGSVTNAAPTDVQFISSSVSTPEPTSLTLLSLPLLGFFAVSGYRRFGKKRG